jgi:A118 family predicted phage portal protein
VKDLAGWYAGDKGLIYPQNRGAMPGVKHWWQVNVTASGSTLGWGESSPIHVPLAADLARTSADLLFSDCPDITVGDAGQDRWEEIEDGTGLESALVEAAELAAALSGIYWRVTFDLVNEKRWPIPTFVQPDNAWPEWSWGQLVAVTFFRVLTPTPGSSDRTVYRHLERHSVTKVGALIEHALYQGEEAKLGMRIPLVDHPETAGIADSLTAEDMIVMPGCTRTAGYIPNMLPNRLDRGSRLGRPDIEQQEDMLRGVDETWTSWMRDLRLAKARIIVPDEYLRVGTAGQGASFDVDREVYSPLRMMAPTGTDPSAAIKLTQFAIRTAEHQATIRALVERVVVGAGYNLFTFGMADPQAAAATATEVDARSDLSLVTKGKKSRYWEPALREMVAAMTSIDWFFRYPGAIRPGDVKEISVEIEREIAPRPLDTAQTANLLRQANAASTQTLIELVHPEWGEEQVKAEVARIEQESGTPVPAPDALGGAAGGSPVDALLAGMGQMDGQQVPVQPVMTGAMS